MTLDSFEVIRGNPLSSESKSIIYNINQIDRGYQNIDQRLNALGAQIRRI